jgi:mono/diheme cytochrome c family protein
MILGIVQDWFFALPGIFIPNAVLSFGGAAPAWQPLWPAYACSLLLVLSLLYVPAAAGPLGNWPFSVLAVLARFGGAAFFFLLHPGEFPALFGTLDLSFGLIQAVLLALAALRGEPGPVTDDPSAPATWWPLILRVLAALLIAGVLAGASAWYYIFREVPQPYAGEEEFSREAFLYGSIGTEDAQGLPYWVWVVLPRVFPEYLPEPRTGGYAALGILWEPGEPMPVGFSKKTIGFDRVGINCALCHAGSYRVRAEGSPTVVAGAPATRVDPLAYQRFLFACASDPRFNADVLMRAIGYETKLSAAENLLYRRALIPRTRAALLEQKKAYAWTQKNPDWGRGRIDPFNPVKFTLLEMEPDGSVGNSDMQPLWNRRARVGHSLHWDGLNTSLTEVVDSGAIGDGATYKSLPAAQLRKMEAWLMDLQPPAYPWKELGREPDEKLIAAGRQVYAKTCAVCHATGKEKMEGEPQGPSARRNGTVIPIDEIRTDRSRLGMWSQDAADRYNTKAQGYPFAFKSFVKNDGYLAVPLDGLWLRGPYLHNGSVPTVADLLKPAAERPTVFWRGYDVIDPVGLGFISGEEARKAGGWKQEVARDGKPVPGNGNGGHQDIKDRDGKVLINYGTGLPPEQRKALLEFLKTL